MIDQKELIDTVNGFRELLGHFSELVGDFRKEVQGLKESRGGCHRELESMKVRISNIEKHLNITPPEAAE